MSYRIVEVTSADKKHFEVEVSIPKVLTLGLGNGWSSVCRKGFSMSAARFDTKGEAHEFVRINLPEHAKEGCVSETAVLSSRKIVK